MVKHMIKNSAEEVSMLMDDEVDEHSRVRIIHKLRDDATMKSCWERYHLISEALRNNLPEIIDPDLANRISSIINEDPHQDPRLPSTHHTPELTRRPSKTVTGFALAASLAAIAVVGLLRISNQGDMPDQQLATARQEITVAPEIQPASVIQDNSVPQDNAVAALNMPALSSQPVDLQIKQVGATPQTVDADLYDYLIHHNEYAATMPVQGGMMPYARMVGYAADE